MYGTSEDFARAERDTPTRAELAERLPKADGRRLLDGALERRKKPP